MLHQGVLGALFSEHGWLRALRMTTYGFLLYGPGTYEWYQFLDRTIPKQTFENLLAKVGITIKFSLSQISWIIFKSWKCYSLQVILNQIVLGPTVIAVVFAWNNLWQGKLSELPNKYQKDALPALFFGMNLFLACKMLRYMHMYVLMLYYCNSFAGFRFWIPVSILNFWYVICFVFLDLVGLVSWLRTWSNVRKFY